MTISLFLQGALTEADPIQAHAHAEGGLEFSLFGLELVLLGVHTEMAMTLEGDPLLDAGLTFMGITFPLPPLGEDAETFVSSACGNVDAFLLFTAFEWEGPNLCFGMGCPLNPDEVEGINACAIFSGVEVCLKAVAQIGVGLNAGMSKCDNSNGLIDGAFAASVVPWMKFSVMVGASASVAGGLLEITITVELTIMQMAFPVVLALRTELDRKECFSIDANLFIMQGVVYLDVTAAWVFSATIWDMSFPDEENEYGGWMWMTTMPIVEPQCRTLANPLDLDDPKSYGFFFVQVVRANKDTKDFQRPAAVVPLAYGLVKKDVEACLLGRNTVLPPLKVSYPEPVGASTHLTDRLPLLVIKSGSSPQLYSSESTFDAMPHMYKINQHNNLEHHKGKKCVNRVWGKVQKWNGIEFHVVSESKCLNRVCEKEQKLWNGKEWSNGNEESKWDFYPVEEEVDGMKKVLGYKIYPPKGYEPIPLKAYEPLFSGSLFQMASRPFRLCKKQAKFNAPNGEKYQRWFCLSRQIPTETKSLVMISGYDTSPWSKSISASDPSVEKNLFEYDKQQFIFPVSFRRLESGHIYVPPLMLADDYLDKWDNNYIVRNGTFSRCFVRWW